MDVDDIAKCYFIPMSTMEKAVDFIENKPQEPNRRCKRNLLDLQNGSNNQGELNRKKWRTQLKLAIRRAVYSHDWNKLLYLLKKSPIWEHDPKFLNEFDFYVRALALLLMNHTNAKAQGLLNDYLHMVLSCRSDEDKRAMLKVILSLPEKIVNMKKHFGQQS